MDVNNRCRYVPREGRSALEILALIGRVVTLPAILAAAVLFTFLIMRPEVYAHKSDFAVSFFCLVVCPVLAYPIAKAIPALRKKGREGARDTAFLTSVIGYLIGVTYAFAIGASPALSFVHATYFFSVVLLLFCNKAVGLRASAHSCGAVGAAVLFGTVMGGFYWLISLAVFLFALWSSLSLKRHDGKEFLFGALCVLGGFMLAILCTVIPAMKGF